MTRIGGGSSSVASPALVLASASPRRAEILRMLGLDFDVDVASIPEDVRPGEPPSEHVLRLATEKAAEVAGRRPEALVLGGDTVVVDGNRILGKPADADQAVSMLESLSGRTHSVLTGMALHDPASGRIVTASASARVTFHPLDTDEIRAYVETGEPLDKAGAYAIQELGASLVASIEGDYYAVVGLSVACLRDLLGRAGYVLRPARIVPAT